MENQVRVLNKRLASLTDQYAKLHKEMPGMSEADFKRRKKELNKQIGEKMARRIAIERDMRRSAEKEIKRLNEKSYQDWAEHNQALDEWEKKHKRLESAHKIAQAKIVGLELTANQLSKRMNPDDAKKLLDDLSKAQQDLEATRRELGLRLTPEQATAQKAKIEELKQKLHDKTLEAWDLDDAVSNHKKRLEDEQQWSQQQHERINKLREQGEQLNRRIGDHVNTIQEKDQQIAQRNEELSRLREQLGRAPTVEEMQEIATQIHKLMDQQEEAVAERDRAIADMNAARDAHRTLRDQFDQVQAEADDLRGRVADLQGQLAAATSPAERAELEGRIAAAEADAAKQKKKKKKFKKKLKKLKKKGKGGEEPEPEEPGGEAAEIAEEEGFDLNDPDQARKFMQMINQRYRRGELTRRQYKALQAETEARLAGPSSERADRLREAERKAALASEKWRGRIGFLPFSAVNLLYVVILALAIWIVLQLFGYATI